MSDLIGTQTCNNGLYAYVIKLFAFIIHYQIPMVFFEEDAVKTLEEQYSTQQIWIEHPSILFPYLIYVDDIPAGFCLV